MKIVLDTNVLVSGLLNLFNPPGEIVRMTSAGTLSLCYDARILAEYREVLLRPKFRFDAIHIDALLDQIKADGHLVAAQPLANQLPDPDDEMFLEVTISGGARCLVTGNVKHYPPTRRQGMDVVRPAELLEIYRQEVLHPPRP